MASRAIRGLFPPPCFWRDPRFQRSLDNLTERQYQLLPELTFFGKRDRERVSRFWAASTLVLFAFVFYLPTLLVVLPWRIWLERGTIHKAPGSFLAKMAEFIVFPRTYDLVFKPILSDFEMQYFNALNQGRRTWLIRFRETARFFWHFLLHPILSIIDKISGILK